MQSKKMPVLYLAQAGVIAAIYVVLTILANALGIGSMAIQFRFSEVLTILPALTSAAIPGLTVGCFLGNLATSPLGPVDWVFGTAATLLGALLCYALRNFKWKGLPIASSLMAVVSNMVIVSFEITCLGNGTTLSFANFGMKAFLLTALSVGIGELVMCSVAGLVLYHALERSHAAQRLFAAH